MDASQVETIEVDEYVSPQMHLRGDSQDLIRGASGPSADIDSFMVDYLGF